ncbi:saccharopine dehydrogenase NADP-binding domain-containing protein [Haloechinothrix sp. YIM 98757]|uniref:Saccharopine dehydrogenase NADP-binding domain-containing protein n=1 Tax=Haloechinothrix aidingensis TaxID=2752311 RepID=A0A838A5S0_9PSEU|nr:saccharopine dehydrogenase NADP-binding domain-containing protein [Haloechinothrix aidingensis]MBA0124085.1 saccharopine dehydrogenase NADP-binding domain-containing protein [Haloechinothrix aidingensis]
MAHDRTYDLVVVGATGFTGGLTAEYLAAHAPADCRWALAGRDQGKLETVRARLAEIDPSCARLPLLHADIGDPDSLRELARSTKVVITTVGPYLRYGEPLVAACAETGTDYVDLTGEPEFVDRMYLAYHDQAVSTGARLVHACGFDSVPHDLGVYYTVSQLPSDRPIRMEGFLRGSGNFSGGTFASALEAMSRARQMNAVSRQRRDREGRPGDRIARSVPGKPRHNKIARSWVLPMPTIDPLVVARSARAVERYGPDFRYSHYAAVKRLPVAVGGVLGAGALAALAQIPPVRTRLAALRKPGEGPSESQRAKSWFTVRFHGVAGDREVVTEVSGGDPGYGETSKMLAESALCLAFDDLPETAGQVTTATAMAEPLIARLRDAGISFNVLDGQPAHPPGPRR